MKPPKMFCLTVPYDMTDPEQKASFRMTIADMLRNGTRFEKRRVAKNQWEIWRERRPCKRSEAIRMEKGSTPVCIGKRGGRK